MRWQFAAVAVALFCVGCRSSVADKFSDGGRTAAVIVAVGNSPIWGDCPGTGADCRRIASVLEGKFDDVVVLENESATDGRVREALAEAFKRDLAVFYFSGHGGQDVLSNDGAEADGVDEYACLYNGAIYDNELWKMACAASNRVFMVFDCCNAGTLYRGGVYGMAAGFGRLAQRRGIERPKSLLCWSGSLDGHKAWGTPRGGYFTDSLLESASRNETYSDVWEELVEIHIAKLVGLVLQSRIGENTWEKPLWK